MSWLKKDLINDKFEMSIPQMSSATSKLKGWIISEARPRSGYCSIFLERDLLQRVPVKTERRPNLYESLPAGGWRGVWRVSIDRIPRKCVNLKTSKSWLSTPCRRIVTPSPLMRYPLKTNEGDIMPCAFLLFQLKITDITMKSSIALGLNEGVSLMARKFKMAIHVNICVVRKRKIVYL